MDAEIEKQIEKWKRSIGQLQYSSSATKETSESVSISICPTSQEGNKEFQVYDIRNSLRPIAIIAKIFGLLPCYDLNFSKSSAPQDGSITRLGLLDYLYSFTLFIFLTGGTVYCTIYPPLTLGLINPATEDTDRIVVNTSFYTSMIMGVLSLSIFPRKYGLLLEYIEHFAGLDRVLGFYSKNPGLLESRKERRLGWVLTVLLVIITILLSFMFVCLYVLELPERGKGTSDYIMVPLVTLAAMAAIVPNGLLIFFLSAIRARLIIFNYKLRAMVQPLTFSISSCQSYMDYGNEILRSHGDGFCTRKRGRDISEDLEKMRILHEELAHAVKLTSGVFGTHLLRDFVSSVLSIILFTYFTLFLRHEDMIYWYAYPIMDIVVLMKLLLLSTNAEFIKNEGAASLRYLHKSSLLRSSPQCSLQIQLLAQKLNQPLCISACGYFNIDRLVITSTICSTFMLFIIVVQFKVTGRGYLL